VKAVSRLIASAGSSLEKFTFSAGINAGLGKSTTVTCTARWVILFDFSDALFQHFDLTNNTSLQSISLHLYRHSCILLFLRHLTRSSNPPSLKQLNIPTLLLAIGTRNLELIDEMLQHPYFSSLQEFCCMAIVRFGSEDVKG
jgi:hypothetical protein